MDIDEKYERLIILSCLCLKQTAHLMQSILINSDKEQTDLIFDYPPLAAYNGLPKQLIEELKKMGIDSEKYELKDLEARP